MPLSGASRSLDRLPRSGHRFLNMRILGELRHRLRRPRIGRVYRRQGADQKVTAGDLIQIFPDIAHSYGPALGETWTKFTSYSMGRSLTFGDPGLAR